MLKLNKDYIRVIPDHTLVKGDVSLLSSGLYRVAIGNEGGHYFETRYYEIARQLSTDILAGKIS
jgi:hypothetical protein